VQPQLLPATPRCQRWELTTSICLESESGGSLGDSPPFIIGTGKDRGDLDQGMKPVSNRLPRVGIAAIKSGVDDGNNLILFVVRVCPNHTRVIRFNVSVRPLARSLPAFQKSNVG
jgi:hypothetical protein